jgi:hypothetical protein
MEKINLVVSGAYWNQQQNLHNHGWWSNIYVDYSPIKSNNWNFGVFGDFNKSSYTQNLTRSSGQATDVSLGLMSGYYSDKILQSITRKYAWFSGLNVGLKYSYSQDESANWLGHYKGVQTDYLFTVGLNCNLLKKSPGHLPRTQLMISWQKPWRANKKSFWNNSEFAGTAWDKTYGQIQLKQSVIDIFCPYLAKSYLSPKLVLLAESGSGNQLMSHGFGLEASLHLEHRDDFAAVYCWYTKNIRSSKNLFIFGITINLINLNKLL